MIDKVQSTIYSIQDSNKNVNKNSRCQTSQTQSEIKYSAKVLTFHLCKNKFFKKYLFYGDDSFC